MEGETVIGRDLIDSPDVSRRHARITIHGDLATIEDLGSKNGTFVGGRRITTAVPLLQGDEVLLGRRRIALRARGGGSETITVAPLSGSRG